MTDSKKELDWADMTEDQKEEFLEKNRQKAMRIKKEKEQRDAYNWNLKYKTAKSFKDVPDEIKNIRVTSSSSSTISIEWGAPANNNSKIISYNVYLSDVKTASSKFKKMAVVSLNSFTLIGLKSDTVYYVIVTAFNKNGEGYLSKVPNFVRTSSTTTQHPCSLYVWGSNTNSELGLDERDVLDNSENYHKSDDCVFLDKPILQTKF